MLRQVTDLSHQLQERLISRGSRFFPLDSTLPCHFNSLSSEMLNMLLHLVATQEIHYKDILAISEVSCQFYITSRSNVLWRKVFRYTHAPQLSEAAARKDRIFSWFALTLNVPILRFDGIYVSTNNTLADEDSDLSAVSVMRFFSDGFVVTDFTQGDPHILGKSLDKEWISGCSGKYHFQGLELITEVQRGVSVNHKALYEKQAYTRTIISSYEVAFNFTSPSVRKVELVMKRKTIRYQFRDPETQAVILEESRVVGTKPPFHFIQLDEPCSGNGNTNYKPLA